MDVCLLGLYETIKICQPSAGISCGLPPYPDL